MSGGARCDALTGGVVVPLATPACKLKVARAARLATTFGAPSVRSQVQEHVKARQLGRPGRPGREIGGRHAIQAEDREERKDRGPGSAYSVANSVLRQGRDLPRLQPSLHNVAAHQPLHLVDREQDDAQNAGLCLFSGPSTLSALSSPDDAWPCPSQNNVRHTATGRLHNAACPCQEYSAILHRFFHLRCTAHSFRP